MIKTIARLNLLNDVEFVYLEDLNKKYTMSIIEYISFCNKKRIKTYIHDIRYNAYKFTEILMKNKYVSNINHPSKPKEFKKLTNKQGDIFFIDIKVNSNKCIRIVDSKKILNFTEEELKNDFLNIKDELDYFNIVGKSLNEMFIRGFTKDTLSSNAYGFWKKNRFKDLTENQIKVFMPKLSLEVDDFIRRSYFSSWLYLNEDLKEETVGVCIDINSSFPSSMLKDMPWGTPLKFEGQYEYDKSYPLYIIEFKVDWCTIRKDKFPFITKEGIERMLDSDYMECCEDKVFVLNNVDFELFKETYKVGNYTFIGGLKFRACDNFFNEYVNYFYDKKCNSEGIEKKISKLFLNSLYGKFGNKIYKDVYNYSIESDREVREYIGNLPIGYMYYTALSSFINSYARENILKVANQNFDKVIYADTDSLHMCCDLSEVKGAEINSNKLGAWKVEKEFSDAKFIGLKCYGHKDKYNNKWNFKIAGLPKEISENLKIDEFFIGSSIKCDIVVCTETGFTPIERQFTIGGLEIFI